MALVVELTKSSVKFKLSFVACCVAFVFLLPCFLVAYNDL